MNPNRKNLIEAIAKGDARALRDILPYKYFFLVDEKRLIVTDITTSPTTVTDHHITGNWRDPLTMEQRLYVEICERMGRICCHAVM